MGSSTADAAGGYLVRGLPAGSYVVQVNADGFALSVSPPIQLAAGQSKTIDVKMSVEGSTQVVEVGGGDGSAQVSTDPEGNASSVALKDKDLDALSDDPDELSSELSALAGPAAGPNGGQVYIDGFTGGELPPKSAIREIRINSNAFSAEFDRLGYGRIQVLTKPGTDTLHGRGFIQGNDKTFNTGNPFAASLPQYYSVQYNGTVSGAISKSASYFVSVEQRNNQNDTVYKANIGPASDCIAGTYVASTTQPGTGACSGGFFSPSTHTNVSPGIDLQLGQKNTLTLRYQFFDFHSTSLGGGGSSGTTPLPSEANFSSDSEHTIQISDDQVISPTIVDETRFQYLIDLSKQNPAQGSSILLPQIAVPGSFAKGGSTDQVENDKTQHLELQNYVTMTTGRHAIKFGTRIRDDIDSNTSTSSFNGSFSFPSLQAYIDTVNAIAANPTEPVPTVITNLAASSGCTPTNGSSQSPCTPNKLSYSKGAVYAQGNVLDAALFFRTIGRRTGS